MPALSSGQSSPPASTIRVFGAYSVNADAVFAHALVGVVRSSSTFSLEGTNVEYIVTPTTLPDTFIVVTGQPFGQPPAVSYSDHFSDVGLAATVGGGIDLSEQFHLLGKKSLGEHSRLRVERPHAISIELRAELANTACILVSILSKSSTANCCTNSLAGSAVSGFSNVQERV